MLSADKLRFHALPALRKVVGQDTRGYTSRPRPCGARTPFITHLVIRGRCRSTPLILSDGSSSACRRLSLSSIPAILIPPVVFTSLLLSLWTYKCIMMIIFQNRIIYMPSMPPFSRSEEVSTYERECRPVVWHERSLRSLDGTKLALLEGNIPSECDLKHELTIVYFQGNGSSTPPRLPELSRVLINAQKRCPNVKLRLLALSYRGYWKSKGRPSQKGIEMDAQALLSMLADDGSSNIVLWGQSIGAGVATTALAAWVSNSALSARLRVSGILLETPFTSLRRMLTALYPQKFLPYRYLGPFLVSKWDSLEALDTIGRLVGAESGKERGTSIQCLLLEAGSDELVPQGEAQKLLGVCQKHNALQARYEVVAGAFHTNVMSKPSGRKKVADFLELVAKQAVDGGR